MHQINPLNCALHLYAPQIVLNRSAARSHQQRTRKDGYRIVAISADEDPDRRTNRQKSQKHEREEEWKRGTSEQTQPQQEKSKSRERDAVKKENTTKEAAEAARMEGKTASRKVEE
jgi:hypothetical protein